MADEVAQEPMGIEVPEGTETEPTESKVDVDGILSMLEEADVKSPAELEGKLMASQQVGNLAYQLGETRKQLDELKSRSVQPSPTDPDRFDSRDNGSIDIEVALEGAVEKVLSKREAMAQEANQRQMLTWSKIRGHPYYSKVKEIFQERMQSPEMISKIQAGQTDTTTEFFNTVIDFQSGVIQKAAGTIKTWKTGDNTNPATPEIESGQARVSAQTPEAKAEKQKTIDGLKQKVNKGGLLREEEEMAALDAILGP